MHQNKIGRNESCWCGSKKKYKKCHQERDKQKPLEHWEAGKEFNRSFSREICSSPDSLHHECSKQIIKAHTVPKSSSLKVIAENGHVLGLKMSLESIRKFKVNPNLEKIGINNASIFNGFCKTHDDSFFASIEKNDFINSEEQCFFLAYRSFAREFYTKLGALETAHLRHQADKGKSLDAQFKIQISNSQIDFGTQLAIKDLNNHKKSFDYAIENNDFSTVRAVVFTLDSAPPVMVCGSVNPDYDFNGMLIQDLMEFDTRSETLSVTSFVGGTDGKIVFSWLENSHDVCSKLLCSLFKKAENDLSSFIVQYIVKNFENFFVSPVWWQGIDSIDKKQLLNLVKDSVSLDKAPSALGLDKKLINIEFPLINNIECINWTFEKD